MEGLSEDAGFCPPLFLKKEIGEFVIVDL